MAGPWAAPARRHSDSANETKSVALSFPWSFPQKVETGRNPRSEQGPRQEAKGVGAFEELEGHSHLSAAPLMATCMTLSTMMSSQTARNGAASCGEPVAVK